MRRSPHQRRRGLGVATVVLGTCVTGIVAAAWPRTSPGDCNGDGRVDAADLHLGVATIFARAGDLACPLDRFDLDGDGRATAADLVAVVRLVLGLDAREPPPTPAPTGFFTDVTAAAGLDFAHGYRGRIDDLGDDIDVQTALFAGGVAAGDFDGDGWVDLYVVRGDIGPNLLLRNGGDGTFEDVAAAAGVAVDGERGSGPAFADYDGDGHLDLFIGGVAGTRPRLFRNLGDGTFEETTVAAGLEIPHATLSATFADYDRDGHLDLLLAHWGTLLGRDPVEHLWRNQGDGTFLPVAQAAGLAGLASDPIFDFTMAPNFADLDDDGWPDIAFASDFGTSRVFLNNCDGTFRDVTDTVITDENGMGAALGDFDGDGILDWFVTSIWDPSGTAAGNWGVTGNRLYRGRGDGTFLDATDSAGVREGFWGWAACAADFDNDGWLDIFHVNGVQLESATAFHQDPARLFRNRGDGTFEQLAEELGLADRGQGRGVVCFDFDNDGDIDIFIANNGERPRLYRNDGAAGRSVRLRLIGRSPNTGAVGARVELTAAGRRQLREVGGSNNYVSHDPLEVHFGVGSADTVDLRIRWPDGDEKRIEGRAVDGSVWTLAQADANP